MSCRELIRRYFVFIISVFVIAFGLSGIVRADLGTSPISSTPFVFSVNTPLTIGAYLFILCLLFIVVQMLFLGRKGVLKNKFNLLVQIPISFVFGACTDLSMRMLSEMQPELYLSKMAILLIGSVVLAVGICLEVRAGVAMMGGEYTVQLVAKRFRREFGTMKLLFDVTLVLLALISSLLFSGAVVGIREGTVITALAVGPLVKCIMPRVRFIDKWLESTQC